RSNAMVDRRVPKPRIGATRDGGPPATDIVAGTRGLAGVVSAAAGKPCRLRPVSPHRRTVGGGASAATLPGTWGATWPGFAPRSGAAAGRIQHVAIGTRPVGGNRPRGWRPGFRHALLPAR